ncbi:MAG: hypothetical protein K2X80_08520 [Pseudomonadaceae bacterium]|nr:hypothetical protein [Pseudomonadaceae bacterium]
MSRAPDDFPRYTARNSKPETVAAIQRYASPEIARRAEDKQRLVQQAKALRIAARLDESFDAETSGDPFRAGVNLLKNRLLCVREACEIFALHRADSAVNGIIEGLRMFKVIKPEQWRALIKLRDNAYNYRLKELQP